MIHPTAQIHPTSIVEAGAKIGENVVIGPFCLVGAEVEIGAGTIYIRMLSSKALLRLGAITKFFNSPVLATPTKI